MTRIGVISDTHIPIRAKDIPAEVAAAFKGMDMLIHAGDLVDYSVIGRLKKICPDVRAVWGNMDPEEVRAKLREKELFKVGKFIFGLAHGYGSPANIKDTLQAVFKDEKLDVLIFGHSHTPFNQKIGNTLFFNPGSATDKVFAPYNSYGIIEVNDKIEAKIIRI